MIIAIMIIASKSTTISYANITHVSQCASHNATNLIKLLSCWQRPRFPLQYYNGKLKLTANVANVTVELIKTLFAADLSLAKTLRLS